jgi:ABC-type bacteriocin/lantibiotic exporter with double-glycine peptidase domain
VRRVIQQDSTGCGIACIAMLAGQTYEQVRKLALSVTAFEEGGPFYTCTKDLVSLGAQYNLKIGIRRRKFKNYDALPDKAILAINYKEETDTWHWVLFHRTADDQYVLDPMKSIKNEKRKDLGRIANKATHWLGVECA